MNVDYELLAATEEDRVSLNFCGRRQDPDFRWHATFVALQNNRHRGERPYIEIGETHHNVTELIVGVNAPVIDKSTIIKTIIMIRNYKGLHPGRHEFGRRID
jgi:hypothetical protein